MEGHKEPRKNAFKLYYDAVEALLNDFTDIEVGIIFRAVCNYELYGDMPDFDDRSMRVVFNRFRGDLDRNMDRYIATCNRNKANRNKSTNTKPLDGAAVTVPGAGINVGEEFGNTEGNQSTEAMPICNGDQSRPVVTTGCDNDNENGNESESENGNRSDCYSNDVVRH